MISQKGLDITGHNLSNMTTPGYSRQRVDVYSLAPPTYAMRYGTKGIYLSGQGADAGGIGQIRDKFLDKRFRDEYGSVGYYDKTTDILMDIEGVLNEFGLNPDDTKAQTAMEAALGKITSTLSSMTNKQGDSTTYATILFTAFKDMSQLINQFDTKLKDVANHAYNDLEVSTASVNAMLMKISELNQNIAKDMLVTKSTNGEYYGPNELLDERNLLIDELSSYGDILVTPNPDGTVDIDMNRHRVIDSKTNKYEQFNIRRDTNGTASLTWKSTGKPVQMTKGSFKGSLDIINGRGANAHLPNELTTKGVRFYQDKMNALAETFARVANESIPQYQTVDGTPGGEPIIRDGQYIFEYTLDAEGNFTTTIDPDWSMNNKYRPLVESFDGKPVITAENISVSTEWANNSAFVIFKKGSVDASPLAKLFESLTTGEYTFRGVGEIGDGLFTGSFTGFIRGYTMELATDISFHKGRLSATTEISLDLQNRRDEISGVSENDCAVDMMTYSRSFQAAGRLMTALDEALDVIINKMGLVGR